MFGVGFFELFVHFCIFSSLFTLLSLCPLSPLLQNYYEELVSVRGSQLSRLQSEVDRLTVECDRQKSEMDDIVLELQQQMYVQQ